MDCYKKTPLHPKLPNQTQLPTQMKFCVPLYCPLQNSNRKSETGISLSAPGYAFRQYTDLEAVPDDFWQLASDSGDYFLQKDYLRVLHDFPPEGMRFSYLLFTFRGAPVGLVYCQLLEFRAGEHLRQPQHEGIRLRGRLAAHLKLRVLICGNAFLTGQHAYFFTPEHQNDSGELIREALGQTADWWRQENLSVNTILFKDIADHQVRTVTDWQHSSYHRFAFQPNMVFPLARNWEKIDHYLEALSSKYRVRYRRARKKLKGIRCVELNAAQIRTHEPEIYRLYRNTAGNADFCVAYLSRQYFSELKTTDPERFRLWAYFKGEQMVGFCTSLQNGKDLEAHFLGLNEAQQVHQLYLNMLYHLVEVGIDSKAERIVFARTAMEIKSSVGAVPEATSVFLLHHTSSVVNYLVPYLVCLLEPKDQWETRHPFRAAEEVAVP